MTGDFGISKIMIADERKKPVVVAVGCFSSSRGQSGRLDYAKRDPL